MREEQVSNIRALFVGDAEASGTMCGIPHGKDILSELRNTLLYANGQIRPLRKRLRLALVMTDVKQHIIGYAGISLVRNATPTRYEHEHVWGGKRFDVVSGMFIRSLIVETKERHNGYGSVLLQAIRVQARGLSLSTYIDVSCSNTPMRKFLHSEGGAPSIFWHSPKGVLMVRYRF